MNKTLAALLLGLLCAAAARAELVSAESGSLRLTAAASGDSLVIRASADRGLNWSSAEVTVTGESLSLPRAAIDPLGNFRVIFLAGNPQLGRSRLYYTAYPSPEPRALFDSLDEIAAPALTASAERLIVSWEAGYRDRKNSYQIVSLDQGRHFGSVRSGQFRYGAPPAPAPVRPANGAATASPTPEIVFRAANSEPVTVRVEFSPERSLAPGKTWTFDLFCLPGTGETALRLPFQLTDGRYYWRLSANDGLNGSQVAAPASFEVDTRAPVISWSAPTGETSDDDRVVVTGRLNEPAGCSLNGQTVVPSADGSFAYPVQLRSGRNRFELIATDEAGNTGRLVRELVYNAGVPHFQVLRPRAGDWFKPGAAFYFEADVSGEAALEDESEGEIALNGRALADRPAYDRSSGKLSGFVTLPPALRDGKYTATVSLQGGHRDFAINIDSTPPAGTAASGETVYAGSDTLLPLPLRDAGSGLDPQGTLVKMNGASLEVVPTTEALARSRFPLNEGTYEVAVYPRDLVGNTGEAVVFQLVVDTQPPALSLMPAGRTAATLPKWPVSGEAGDRYLSAVNFYNGANLVGTIRNAPGPFCFNCPLVNGRNLIRVEAVDRAGNKTSQTLTVQAELASAALITRFAAAPVPFSPRSDGTLYFTFAFAGTPQLLRIYIFDLSGTLIWRRDLPGQAIGNATAWNGSDLFGRRVDNGVYPYLAAVTLNGQTEIKRGKLIVLQ